MRKRLLLEMIVIYGVLIGAMVILFRIQDWGIVEITGNVSTNTITHESTVKFNAFYKAELFNAIAWSIILSSMLTCYLVYRITSKE